MTEHGEPQFQNPLYAESLRAEDPFELMRMISAGSIACILGVEANIIAARTETDYDMAFIRLCVSYREEQAMAESTETDHSGHSHVTFAIPAAAWCALAAYIDAVHDSYHETYEQDGNLPLAVSEEVYAARQKPEAN